MPGQVDFYLLESSDESSRLKTVCRLAEKIYKMGHDILVLTKDVQQSKMLDTLMWTFSQSSFLPHARVITDAVEESDNRDADWRKAPVLIHHEALESTPQVLINLKNEIPQSEDLKRVVEIVNQDEQIKINSRDKYRNYKNQQYAIKTHNIPTR